MGNKKNVLIIIHKLNGGGAERCASNLSIELAKTHNVYLACFDCQNITYPHGGKLIDIDVKNSSNNYLRLINTYKRIKTLKKIKKLYKIDCSISLLDGPNIANVFSCIGERLIVSVRNCLSKEPMSIIRKKLITYTCNKADKTITLSKYVGLDLIKNFSVLPKKIETIYNHCDANLLKNMAQFANSSQEIPDGFKYITMGRLCHQKGQWHLIRAFKNVLRIYPNSKLLIFGDGEYRDKLEKLAKDLEISENVLFYGYVTSPHSYLSKCDCFVFPSLFEGLGNVLLEAIAFNLPIISADCEAGPREILSPESDIDSFTSRIEYAEYGILIPVMDNGHFDAVSELTIEEEELAKAMIEIQNNTELCQRYRDNTIKRIEDFRTESIISKWDEIIKS